MSINNRAPRVYIAFYADRKIKHGRGRYGDVVLDADENPIVDSSKAECFDRANDSTNAKISIICYQVSQHLDPP